MDNTCIYTERYYACEHPTIPKTSYTENGFRKVRDDTNMPKARIDTLTLPYACHKCRDLPQFRHLPPPPPSRPEYPPALGAGMQDLTEEDERAAEERRRGKGGSVSHDKGIDTSAEKPKLNLKGKIMQAGENIMQRVGAMLWKQGSAVSEKQGKQPAPKNPWAGVKEREDLFRC